MSDENAAPVSNSVGAKVADEEAAVRRHLRIADIAARGFRGQGRDADDLDQVARLGLLKAVRRYDEEIGEFASYAMPTIRGELKRYLRDSGWVVRPPRHIQELRTTLEVVNPRLTQRLGHTPSAKELAAELGEARQQVDEALEAHTSWRPESLDSPPADGRALEEVLGASDENFDHIEDVMVLRAGISRLNHEQRELLYYRFFEEESQQRIAERLGMTQRQVSRLLGRTLQQLKAVLTLPEPRYARAS